MKKPKQQPEKVRAWAYKIFKKNTGHTLNVLFADGNKLEALIREHGELVMLGAWGRYVIADNPLYNLDPEKGDVTNFPLAGFFTTAEGYILEAKEDPYGKNLLAGPRSWIYGVIPE